MTSEEAKHFQN